MAQEHSFDIVCKVDLQEVRNAVQQAMKEVKQRFDFKGSKADILFDEKAPKLELTAEDDMKLRNLGDVLKARLAKRSVPLRAFDFVEAETAGLGMLRQQVKLQQGIPSDKAKEIVKVLKGTKLKVQAAIQGDQVRVTGKNIDDLQAAMQAVRAIDLNIETQFTNLR